MAKSKLDNLTNGQKKFIVDSVQSGRSYREIAQDLKTHYDFSISHTSIKNWCERNEVEKEAGQSELLEIDPQFVAMFTPNEGARPITPFDILRAQLLGLYKASLDRHKEAGTPINTDYLKQVEALGRIEDKSYKDPTGLGKGKQSAFEAPKGWKMPDF